MKYSLHNGDCLEIMKTIEASSVDLVLCDLPYGTTKCSWDIIIPFDSLWEQYKRILKPTGCAVLFGNNPFTAQLICSNIDWYKQSLVWDKNKCGSPGLAKYRPMQIHEDIVVFAKGKTTYNPQMESGEPYKRIPKEGTKYESRCNNHKYGFKNTGIVNEGTRYPKSIIRISRDFSAQQQVHPTQKPVKLMEWLIKTYSNENDVVIDNCMGSGSTGVACVNTNRNFIGIEKDHTYFQIATNRINVVLKEKEVVNQLFE